MCIDGVTDNQDGLNICLSALDQQDPWLAVTLPPRSLVSEVVVYGRWDCCNDLLTGFEVWLGDEVGQPSVAGGWHLCGRHTQELADGASVTAVSCGVRRGTVAALVLMPTLGLALGLALSRRHKTPPCTSRLALAALY